MEESMKESQKEWYKWKSKKKEWNKWKKSEKDKR